MPPSIPHLEQSALLLLRSGRSFASSDLVGRLAAHYQADQGAEWNALCDRAYSALVLKGFANKYPTGQWSLTQLGTHQALAFLLSAGRGAKPQAAGSSTSVMAIARNLSPAGVAAS